MAPNFVVFFFFLFNAFSVSHSHPAPPDDTFLRMKCREGVLGTPSPACKAYFKRTRTTPAPTSSTSTTSFISTTHTTPSVSTTHPIINNLTIARIATIHAHTHKAAQTTKAITSTLASLSTLYFALVAYFKMRRGFTLRRSLSLGLLGRTQGSTLQASSLPTRISESAISTI